MPRRRPCSGPMRSRCSWNVRAAVQRGFAVDAANAPAILSICSHVDGIPLALRACGRASQRPRARRAGTRSRGSAWRAGRATAARRSGSRRSKGPSTGATGCCASPNAGSGSGCPCSRAASSSTPPRSVCAGDGLDDADIPDLVASLVDNRSSDDDRNDGGRLRLPEPLRQFGRDRLREADEEHAAIASCRLGR